MPLGPHICLYPHAQISLNWVGGQQNVERLLLPVQRDTSLRTSKVQDRQHRLGPEECLNQHLQDSSLRNVKA